MPIVQQPADRRDYGRLCVRDRWQLIVEFPTTTKRLVERHILKHDDLLRDGILILKSVFLALRIEDVEKIGYAALVTLHGELDGAAGRHQRDVQGFLLSDI